MAAFFLVFANVVSASGSQPSLGRHLSHTLPVGVANAGERLWLVGEPTKLIFYRVGELQITLG
eukprot:1736426-Rhodomonas_salina.1